MTPQQKAAFEGILSRAGLPIDGLFLIDIMTAAYNLALEHAADLHGSNCFGKPLIVDKQSILDLKIV